MKQTFTQCARYFTLLVLALMSFSSVWGEEEAAYTNSCPVNSSNSAYATYYDVTISGIVWKAPGNQYADGAWRCGGKSLSGVNRYYYTQTAISDNITKIEVVHGSANNITVNSFKLDVYSTAALAEAGGTGDVSSLTGTFTASTTAIFTRPAGADWSNRFYRFTYNVTNTNTKSNYYVVISSFTFYKEVASGAASQPTFSPAEGTYNADQSVAITTSTEGASIYYEMTTNGDEPAAPTASSTLYSGPITVNVTGTKIKAIAIKAGLDDSSIASATYTLQCVAPTITGSVEGKFGTSNTITLSCDTEGATIYYSTDGTEPSIEYTAPFVIYATTTVKAKATKTNYDDATKQLTFTSFLNGSKSIPFAGYCKSSDSSGSGVSFNSVSSYDNKAQKFDAAGDYVIYSLNGVPGKLKFTIGVNNAYTTSAPKGMDFSVEESSDAESWTTLLSFVEGVEYGDKEFDLSASTKYIRFIYNSKPSGSNVSVKNFAVTRKFTMGEKGYATFFCDSKITMPTGLTAYYGAESTGNTVTLTSLSSDAVIPASEGLVLKGAQGSYEIEASTSTAITISDNLLVGYVNDTEITGSSEVSYYALNYNSEGVGFFVPKGASSATGDFTAKANKAYLKITNGGSAKEITINWGDETGIAEVAVSKEQVAGGIFNLAGQKVVAPVKGQIYIVNGKKVMY